MADDPTSIGRYQITGTLGRGAMGTIYRAHDPDIDRAVAIKLIRADLLEGDDRDKFLARFRREAQAAARCAHPNIVAIYDFALHDGNPFLAMEFVDGLTLSQARPPGGRHLPGDAVFVALQVLAALRAAHAMGIVHRDIKPANIMLSAGTTVKVTDFGIARLNTAGLTARDAVIGTPMYMSPEQFAGAAIDGRGDLYSLGVVLFELLSGRWPFAGRSVVELVTKVLHEPAPDLRALVPDIPPDLAAAVARSLAKHPAERFASADDMAEALTQAIGPAAALADRTRVLPRPARAGSADLAMASAVAPGEFDQETLDTLTRALAEFVGPVAPYLVQSALRKSGTLAALCARLAERLDRPADRQSFQRTAERQLSRVAASTGPRTAPSGAAELSDEALRRLQLALTRHLGPVARVLIKRALPQASSAANLWDMLATHIEDAGARAAFLRERD